MVPWSRAAATALLRRQDCRPEAGRADWRSPVLATWAISRHGSGMTMWLRRRAPQTGGVALAIMLLASCAAPPRPMPAPSPPPPRPVSSLPAAAPQRDWRDVPLTAGNWTWRGGAGQASIAQFGLAGQGALFALRCDLATRAVIFSRGGGIGASASSIVFTTSFGVFSLPASYGGGQPPAVVASANARDPHLDQLAFSRGRFLVDVVGQPRLVLPAWPEVARVIEDCRA